MFACALGVCIVNTCTLVIGWDIWKQRDAGLPHKTNIMAEKG